MRRNELVRITVLASMVVAARGHEVQYAALLSGENVVPPNSSAGAGDVTVTIDLDLVTLHVHAHFKNLSGGTAAAHIHGLTALPFAGTAGVAIRDAGLPAFPGGATDGHYEATLDLTLASSYSADFITASGGTVSDALNALIAGVHEGRMYFDIKTTAFPDGEIRGFLAETRLLGDLNCDGATSVSDIAPFVLALTNPQEYALQFPACDEMNADFNDDHLVTVSDIAFFVATLVG